MHTFLVTSFVKKTVIKVCRNIEIKIKLLELVFDVCYHTFKNVFKMLKVNPGVDPAYRLFWIDGQAVDS